MSLERFREAQLNPANGFAVALDELRAGRKVSHWIWYVFPQLAGLGRSSMAEFYAIADEGEARAYLEDAVLGGNLLLGMEAVAEQLARGVRLEELMGGGTDSLKLISCVTLFREMAGSGGEFPDAVRIAKVCEVAGGILEVAGKQGYPPCARTTEILRS